MRMKVTWGLPISWKPQDRYYGLIYELKYQPYVSSFSYGQVRAGKPIDKWLGIQLGIQFLLFQFNDTVGYISDTCLHFFQKVCFVCVMWLWNLDILPGCPPVYLSVSLQIMTIKGGHSYTTSCTITDAIPGVKYLIQLRTKDEYDGQWSGWSTPVYASSWTGKYTCTHKHTHIKKQIKPFQK